MGGIMAFMFQPLKNQADLPLKIFEGSFGRQTIAI